MGALESKGTLQLMKRNYQWMEGDQDYLLENLGTAQAGVLFHLCKLIFCMREEDILATTSILLLGQRIINCMVHTNRVGSGDFTTMWTIRLLKPT